MSLIHYSFAPLILFRVPYTLDLLPYYLSIAKGDGGVVSRGQTLVRAETLSLAVSARTRVWPRETTGGVGIFELLVFQCSV